jgi:hypothetical protein
MLAKNGLLQNSLEEDNFSLEAEFINKLRDAEQDIAKLEANVAATKGAKVVWLLVARHTSHVTRHRLSLNKSSSSASVRSCCWSASWSWRRRRRLRAHPPPSPPHTHTTCISTAAVLAIKTVY